MTECVSNEIKQLTEINGKVAELNANDTLFITELNNKLDACEADKANYEECLYTVREVVYDDIKELDDLIQTTVSTIININIYVIPTELINDLNRYLHFGVCNMFLFIHDTQNIFFRDVSLDLPACLVIFAVGS